MKRKPRKAKPVVALAIVNEKNEFVRDDGGDYFVFPKQDGVYLEDNERLVKVRIEEIK